MIPPTLCGRRAAGSPERRVSRGWRRCRRVEDPPIFPSLLHARTGYGRAAWRECHPRWFSSLFSILPSDFPLLEWSVDWLIVEAMPQLRRKLRLPAEAPPHRRRRWEDPRMIPPAGVAPVPGGEAVWGEPPAQWTSVLATPRLTSRQSPARRGASAADVPGACDGPTPACGSADGDDVAASSGSCEAAGMRVARRLPQIGGGAVLGTMTFAMMMEIATTATCPAGP